MIPKSLSGLSTASSVSTKSQQAAEPVKVNEKAKSTLTSEIKDTIKASAEDIRLELQQQQSLPMSKVEDYVDFSGGGGNTYHDNYVDFSGGKHKTPVSNSDVVDSLQNRVNGEEPSDYVDFSGGTSYSDSYVDFSGGKSRSSRDMVN